ncbi:MAG: protoheme IX farnesyltransferase [Bacteriovoracaceae bacterium]|jgi:heme o synthase|nr:protoheme IX farnesyltransferase [Bacteriovoracaceae bacterium]
MRVKHLNLFTILITFLLLILGGIVHNTQSSLACPDWPTCYGSFFPKMEGGILIEHGHRLLATLVGFLTTLLVIFTFKNYKSNKKYQSAFHLACVSLVMVIAQGILGGITVIYRLPTIVSTSHLGLSMVFFCTLILLHHRLGQVDKTIDPRIDKEEFSKIWKPSLRHGILGMGVFLYLQMILGAFMRHSGAGTSCGLGLDAWGLCLETSTWTKSWWPSLHPAQLHMVHRYFAVFLGLGILYYCLMQLSQAIKHKTVLKNISNSITFWSAVIIISVISQIGLGIMTVAMNLAIAPTTAHLAVAAICLGSIFKLNLILKSTEEKFFNKGAHSFISDVFELTKPKLSALVVSTSLVGILLAPGQLNFFEGLLSLILIGMVVIGGCALNCYIEIDVDGLMERTKVRSLPSGRLNANWALGFGILMLIIAIPLLVFMVNPLTAILSALAAVLYLFFYTPMKIKSPYAVVVGAIPGAIPPMLGWTTVTGKLDFDVWSLFLILFFWQIPHFLAISIFNAEDYKAAKIKVFPNISGFIKTRNFIVLLTFVMLLIGLLPNLMGTASQLFLFASLILSTIMIILALFGLKHSSQGDELELWSKRYFWGTIIYLPLLLGAMIFLK